MSQSEIAITPALIKELRERTGVGMAKCKEALEEAKGHMDQAIEILRKAGMASAVKKQGRETKEGAIVAKETNTHVALAEINAETDFVAQNERFKQFCQQIVEEVALSNTSSIEEFMQKAYSKDPNITMDQLRSLVIQTIGENIQVRRIQALKKEPGTSIGIYSHMGGKILTAVVLKGSGEEELAKSIAMHVAAAAPEYVSPEHVPQEILVKEREIAKEQVQGKPAYIIDKIVDGKINAFFDQACLTRQKYIRDDSVNIQDFVKHEGKARGKDLEVISFLRWAVAQ